MPASPPAGQQVNNIIPSSGWYVHFDSTSAEGHNDHLVIGWVLLDDNITVVPLIADTDGQTVIQAVGPYTLLHPYNECEICVRPVPPPSEPPL